MSHRYLLHPLAQQEYEASLKWYLERSNRAAENFSLAVEYAFNLICEHPLRWRNEYTNYYELGLKKYPFTIIYTIEENKKLVLIIAVYHQKRKPGRKYRKPRTI